MVFAGTSTAVRNGDLQKFETCPGWGATGPPVCEAAGPRYLLEYRANLFV